MKCQVCTHSASYLWSLSLLTCHKCLSIRQRIMIHLSVTKRWENRMLLNRIQEDIHEFYLKMRMLDRLIETIEFERAYESAVDFRMLRLGIEQLDMDIIKFFITLNRDPGELSYRELRRVAKHYNVPHWSRLSKPELIEEVTNAGQYAADREISRQVDLLSNIGTDKARNADGSDPLAGRATISRHIGIYRCSSQAATMASCLRSKSIGTRRDVGEHDDDGSDRTPRAEDTREVTNGPPIVLES